MRTASPSRRARALERARSDRVLPLLCTGCARCSEEGSDDVVFAHRQLAELLLDRDPWRASLHARALTRMRPDDDRGWAALGLSQSLLGQLPLRGLALERAARLLAGRTPGTRTTSASCSTSRSTAREAVAHLRARYERAAAAGRRDVARARARACARAAGGEAPARARARRRPRRPARAAALLEQARKAAPSRSKGPPTPRSRAPLVRGTARRPPRRTDQRRRRHGRVPPVGRGRAAPRPGRLPLDQAQRLAAADLARGDDAQAPADERAAHGVAASAAWLVISSARDPALAVEVAGVLPRERGDASPAPALRCGRASSRTMTA